MAKDAKPQTKRPDIDLRSIFRSYKTPFVLRENLGEVTGGLLNPKTIRNLDSLGQGIKRKFTISNKKVAYPVEAVIEFLEKKIK